MKKILVVLILFVSTISLQAREGMWLPILLDKNIDEMQDMGFWLTPEDIYNVNHASMKDAVVLFNGGCTGELISDQGLMITNYHCGHSQIQSHSSLENDYLSNGFWAMSQSEEIPNDGLSVTFLIEMKEVTDQVMMGTDSLISENAIVGKKQSNIALIKDKATEGTHYDASIKSFYEGNQYYLFITEKFKDVRLVGAPPASIGKFGGDTDNWVWPRHTGDFAMFRIYADSLNKPAEYAPENVPYQPKQYFPINIRGIDEGDFTMVFGYPGTTEKYLHSSAIEQIINHRNPARIGIRDIKLDIYNEAMNSDPKTRIQYSAKYASVSNSWKRWQGEIKGLKRLDAINVKKEKEAEFQEWVNASEQRKYEYGTVLNEFEKLYKDIDDLQKAKDYYNEIIWRGTDAYRMYRKLAYLNDRTSFDAEDQRKSIVKHFRNYNFEVDKKVFTSLMPKYYKDIESSTLPETFSSLMEKRNVDKKLEKIYNKSILCKQEDMLDLIDEYSPKHWKRALKRDQLYQLFNEFADHYQNKIYPSYDYTADLINLNQKIYMAALLEKETEQLMFPDANLTQRITYGMVEGYRPYNGVYFKHYTTIEGIIQKDNPDIYDYAVPAKLKELYYDGDFGPYTNQDGELPVCFIASNHTTGGNSGSPVINGQGHLIGINFDRAWEGVMSDYMFDPEVCRNISLDMRYMLFIIDKFAGASYLLDEMEIIR